MMKKGCMIHINKRLIKLLKICLFWDILIREKNGNCGYLK